jgi:hypothetical protein
VDVVFQDYPLAAIPSLGMGGFAPTGHLVQLSFDPGAEDFEELIVAHLPRTLAHELHHCARWRGPGYGRSLGDALVSEGLADHFDLEVNGVIPIRGRKLWMKRTWKGGGKRLRDSFGKIIATLSGSSTRPKLVLPSGQAIR